MTTRWHGTIAALALAAPGGAFAQDDPADGDCAALAAMDLEATNMLSAQEVTPEGDLPAFCQVRGYVRPAINFEVRLPLDEWNGKFYMAGCGGFCGTLASDSEDTFNAINHALRRGYAAATMDGGHWGNSSADGRWAKANPVAEVDWAHRAVEETTRVGKAVTERFYAGPPEYSYFQGCSTGGRQANMAALRTPEAFDGIISGAPALDYPGLVGTAFSWIVQANTDADGQQILQPEDVATVQDAVYDACDGDDGVEDGLISDPQSCDFDPASLSDTLSDEKITVLQKWYRPAESGDETLYPAAVPEGSEPFWQLWLTGLEGGGGKIVPAFNRDFLRYMAFPDDPASDFDGTDFDFSADPQRMQPQAELYNSDDPDITPFYDAGGKLLMYHGWADAIVFPGKTIDYWDRMTQASGSESGRLFMIPGMDHCGIQGSGPGIGQTGFDPLGAMERWVEDSDAPERLMTEKTTEGESQWQRPVCAYPARPVFDGEGDWREAGGWSCETD